MDISIRNRAAFRRLAARHGRGEKIRIGFGIINESIFPLSRVFQLMQDDPFFDPFIIVIPDVHRGREYAIGCYKKACISLREMFPAAQILQSYNTTTDVIVDYSDRCDLYAPANPYEIMNPLPYKSAQFAKKNIPIFYSHYGTSIARSDLEALKLLSYWRIYANTEMEYAACKNNGNAFLCGMSRMDSLAFVDESARSRKKVIIAPHHTIFENMNLLTFSQFLRYSDFFLELPKIFSEIDFCFRPHPLLVHNLQSDKAWGKRKTAEWLETMSSMQNVEMQYGGDFLQTFINSDALIHDCGSFIADYMFTGKPCCYMFPEKPPVNDQYNQFGHDCLDAHYSALNKNDILNFINNVIMQGNDPLSIKRKTLFDKIKFNYPHNSETIVENIKNEILIHSF